MTVSESLRAVLASTGPVLLDFDGPMTTLLPPPANAYLADAAREPLLRAGRPLPTNISATKDHLAVLRYAATQPAAIQQASESVCVAAEVDAAQNSQPTYGAHDAIYAFSAVDRPIVVVSNNAPQAISAYIQRHRLGRHIYFVFGRPFGHPELMKPHPELLRQALMTLDSRPEHCLMVGDSVTDIQVGKQVGVYTVGYAKTLSRGRELDAAGADAVVSDMGALALAAGG